MKKIFFVIGAFWFVCSMALPAFAAGADTWVGSSGADLNASADWTTIGGSTPPGAGDSWTFNAAGTSGTTLTSTLTSGLSVASITFGSSGTASAYTIGGNSIQLGTSGITNNSAANSQTLNMNISLAGTTTMTTTSGGVGGNITLGGGISGLGGINAAGTGTLILSGVNTYTGITQVSQGTLEINSGSIGNTISVAIGDSTGGSATLQLDNASSSLTVGAGGITVGPFGSGNCALIDSGGIISTTGVLYVSNGINTATMTISGGGSVTDAMGTISENSFSSSNSVTVTGANSTWTNTSSLRIAPYAFTNGTLTISNSGIVNVGSGTGTVELGSTATLNIGAFGGGSAAGTLQAAEVTGETGGTVVNFNETDASYTFAPNLTGTLSVNQLGSGTTILTGTDTYTGATTVSAGTLSVDGSIESPVTVNNSGNLAGIGEISNTVLVNSGGSLSPGHVATIGSLTINGALTMNSGSTLDVVLKNSTTYSQLVLLSSGNSFASGSILNVTLANGAAISYGNEFLVVKTSGSTATAGTPSVIYSGSDWTFLPSWGTLDANYGLILTAGQEKTYASQASNNNARAAGAVWDNIQAQGTSGDMQTVLNTLSGLSSSGVASALNTLSPTVDRGIIDTPMASLNSFVGASLERAQNVLTLASSGNSQSTGVSAGDESKLNGLWAKEYGGYLDQSTHNGIEGYNAWNTGTAVGVDHLFSDNLTVGASLGYAYGKVNSDANSASTYIDSGEGTLYAAYQGQNHPYFIDAAGSFANNWYDGKRDISVGTINRIADSEYQGQQTGLYVDGGYKFDIWKNIVLTPLTSLQWTHLAIGSYTESNAGDLDLMVNRQSYNILESGLGASLSSQEKYSWGELTPEFHAKWLYDYIGDNMVVTSQYTGGGGAFTSNGASTPKDGVNLGGKLSFDLKHDISVIAGVDTEIKDNFFGVYGSVSLRYKF